MDSEDVAKYLIECGADIRPQKGTGEHFQVVFNGHKSTIPNHCEGCEAHPAGAAISSAPGSVLWFFCATARPP